MNSTSPVELPREKKTSKSFFQIVMKFSGIGIRAQRQAESKIRKTGRRHTGPVPVYAGLHVTQSAVDYVPEIQKTWVKPVYEETWVAGYYSSREPWVEGYGKEVLVQEGDWAEGY